MPTEDYAAIRDRVIAVRAFYQRLLKAGLGDSYEAAHARLALEYWATTCQRLKMLVAVKLTPLPPVTQEFADRSCCQTTINLCAGLEKRIQSLAKSESLRPQQIWRRWTER